MLELEGGEGWKFLGMEGSGRLGRECLMGNNMADTNNRSFLARAYPTMKKNNPHTPIMLREAAGTHPRVYARYGQSFHPGNCKF
jgi:hypothetical protein